LQRPQTRAGPSADGETEKQDQESVRWCSALLILFLDLAGSAGRSPASRVRLQSV
jgi:hypothetical protein